MNDETLQVFSGSAITPEELLRAGGVRSTLALRER